MKEINKKVLVDAMRVDERFAGAEARWTGECIEVDGFPIPGMSIRVRGGGIDTVDPTKLLDTIWEQGRALVGEGFSDWDYEKLRERITIRPYPLEAKGVRESAYRQVGDIALVLYAILQENGNRLSGFKIPMPIARRWGDTDALVDEALKVTQEKSPAMALCLGGECRLVKLPLEDADWEEAGIYGACISTTRGLNGAAAVFYPGVAEQISDRLDDDFYLAFTSPHECMVHPCGMAEPKEMLIALVATNEAMNQEEDFLSNSIYRYSRKTKRITQAM